MKRIELNTGTSERGYWDGNKFDYKLKIHVASYDYNFSEDEYLTEYEKAKEFIKQSGGSPDEVEILNIASGQKFFVFETEDVDNIVKNSLSNKFIVYLKTKSKNLVVCTKGFKNGVISEDEYLLPGEYKRIKKADLKKEYLAAKQLFENDPQSKGAIKLHIHPLTN